MPKQSLAKEWSAQALNLCKFSVGFDPNGKGLTVAHGTELKILFCAKLHLDLPEPKLSDDDLCPFTGDRSQGAGGLFWNSERRTALR